MLFIQAAVEDLPEELNGVADEIHIHFPWGSLLKAAAVGDEAVLNALYRIAAPECLLEVVIGIDPDRDKTELERLSIPDLTPVILHSYLIPKYIASGFQIVESGMMNSTEWSALETTWARKLSSGSARKAVFMMFRAAGER